MHMNKKKYTVYSQSLSHSAIGSIRKLKVVSHEKGNFLMTNDKDSIGKQQHQNNHFLLFIYI